MSRTFVQTLREYGLQLPDHVRHVRLDSAENPTQLIYAVAVTRTLTAPKGDPVKRQLGQ